MAVSRYPCRACGRATEGEDTYVICCSCLAEFELRSYEQPGIGLGGSDGSASDGSPPTALAPDEVEARLRRLFDDW
jgi:hypothetical protein